MTAMIKVYKIWYSNTIIIKSASTNKGLLLKTFMGADITCTVIVPMENSIKALLPSL